MPVNAARYVFKGQARFFLESFLIQFLLLPLLGGFVGFRCFHVRNLLSIIFRNGKFLLLEAAIFLQIIHHGINFCFATDAFLLSFFFVDFCFTSL